MTAQIYPSKLDQFLKYAWSSVRKTSEAKASVLLKIYTGKKSLRISAI